MQDLFAFLAASWQYAIIPVLSALVGWGTNILALRMTFYPLDFIGIPPFLGWQGIIPSKAAKMASRTVDLMTGRLISVEEVTARLETERVVKEIEPYLEPMLEEIIDEVVQEHYPRLWRLLPQAMKDRIFKRAGEDTPRVTEAILNDVRLHIHELLDIKRMSVDILMNNKQLLNEIFLRCGETELLFIERSGLLFGFLFGLAQMGVWIVYPVWWLHPLCGFLVGYLTNWLALRMIFRPLRPRKFGPIMVQGLFLQRQQEVSKEYAKLVTSEVVSAANIMEAIFMGPASNKLLSIIEEHIQQASNDYGGLNEAIFERAAGQQEYSDVKRKIVDRLVGRVPGLVKALVGYAEEALDLENTMRTRMQALTPEEFETLLRTAFEEDEWKLIVVGAILGAAVGWLQLTLLI